METHQSIRDLADVFRFEVPPSHRERVGPAITALKRALIRGLSPFHIEVLRPQRSFNLALAQGVARISEAAARSRAEAASALCEALAPLADPTAWGVAPETDGFAGRVRVLTKRAYLAGLRPMLKDVLEGQRRWNAAAVGAVALIAQPNGDSRSIAAAALSKLEFLCDPLIRPDLALPSFATGGLWREVLRRQLAFNQAVAKKLAELPPFRP